VTEVGNDIRAQVSGSLITVREDLAMYRIRFILTGAVVGIAWACSLRGFMRQLAGADSTWVRLSWSERQAASPRLSW
jgi:hypothetical protein